MELEGKLKGSQIIQDPKSEMDGIKRPHMQLSYLWLSSFVIKNQESTMDENYFRDQADKKHTLRP